MTEKYQNKFNNLKFETNTEKDLEVNSPILSSDLSSEKINDDCSNETLLQYEYSADEQKDELDKDSVE